MSKLEMLNTMFKGTQFERNIKDHMKNSKNRIATAFKFWNENEDKKHATSFLDAWLYSSAY